MLQDPTTRSTHSSHSWCETWAADLHHAGRVPPRIHLLQVPGAAVVRRSGPVPGDAAPAGCGRSWRRCWLGTSGALGFRSCAVWIDGVPWSQGPMSPVTSQLQGAWMLTGVRYAFRFTGLAHTVGGHQHYLPPPCADNPLCLCWYVKGRHCRCIAYDSDRRPLWLASSLLLLCYFYAAFTACGHRSRLTAPHLNLTTEAGQPTESSEVVPTATSFRHGR